MSTNNPTGERVKDRSNYEKISVSFFTGLEDERNTFQEYQKRTNDSGIYLSTDMPVMNCTADIETSRSAKKDIICKEGRHRTFIIGEREQEMSHEPNSDDAR